MYYTGKCKFMHNILAIMHIITFSNVVNQFILYDFI